MFLRLWTMRLAKAWAALSAARFARRRAGNLPIPVLVDIGARGGLQRKWQVYRRLAPLQAILFEADADEAARLGNADKNVRVVAAALGEAEGPATLYLTSDPGCSSLLSPSAQAQELEGVGYRLKVVGTASLALQRADSIFARDNLPAPDFLKLDTQGSELSILRGFGGLLNNVSAIEVECEFHRLYEDQPLIGDVTDFMRDQGFVLVALRPNGISPDGILDTNAFFVKKASLRSPRQEILVELWQRLNRVPSHLSYVIANG